MLNVLPHKYFLKNTIYRIPKVVLDLVDVMGLIFATDISIKKTEATRTLNITIPVTDKKKWEANIGLLRELVSFVSSDDLKIKFTHKGNKHTCSQQVLIKTRPPKNVSNITLLSGGLDSFCGAYANHALKHTPIYISYKTAMRDVKHQTKIIQFLTTISAVYSHQFDRLPLQKLESTQRTRSLLFLALATMTASNNKISDVRIYENGIMSLNPALFGRLTTKTTHPKTLYLFNELLNNLGINISIANPFIFMTKGELLNNLSQNFKKQICNTTSCSRSQQSYYVNAKQCGYCVPCLLRKISLAAYNLEINDCDYSVPYGMKLKEINDNFLNEEYNIISVRLNPEYIQNEYKSATEYFRVFMEKIDNDEIYSYIGKGIREEYYPPTLDFRQKTNEMLRRFSQEIGRYFNKYELY